MSPASDIVRSGIDQRCLPVTPVTVVACPSLLPTADKETVDHLVWAAIARAHSRDSVCMSFRFEGCAGARSAVVGSPVAASPGDLLSEREPDAEGGDDRAGDAVEVAAGRGPLQAVSENVREGDQRAGPGDSQEDVHTGQEHA